MSLIRYQSPEVMAWPPLDRWSSLRDDLNSLFELPFWSSFARQGQLFGGWSPALDLYQDKDNVVAVVELPGMKKEDIDISLRDGTLTISGERKSQTSNGEKRSAPSVISEDSGEALRFRPAWMQTRSAQ